MRLFSTFVLLWLLLPGCGASRPDHDALERRVAVLEKRLRTLETRAGIPPRAAADGRKGRGTRGGKGRRGEAPARGTVAVTGEGVAVLVESGRRQVAVPAQIRAGTFEALAVYEPGATPVEIGPIVIEAGKTTTVRCVAAAQRCEISAPE